jgi:16S rRNA (adenine1518-N6/adenine1519-N6)-dimethyltransferase
MENVKAKKSLGQNWLKSESAIKEIIKAGEITPGDWVLEIGPGRGVLTEKLLEANCKVTAIEKDDRLIGALQEKFADKINNGSLTLIHDDILNINFSEVWKITGEHYKLIANIPYYITGQVIRKFLSEEELQPSLMVLMVQKEVARRIVASDKKESILSISVKVYGEPKYIKTVPAGAFDPAPNVDSAILQIKNISRDFFSPQNDSEEKIDEKDFFEILKKGFAQKRKLLKGNLGIKENIFTACGQPLNARAEDITLSSWQCLIKEIKKQS